MEKDYEVWDKSRWVSQKVFESDEILRVIDYIEKKGELIHPEIRSKEGWVLDWGKKLSEDEIEEGKILLEEITEADILVKYKLDKEIEDKKRRLSHDKIK